MKTSVFRWRNLGFGIGALVVLISLRFGARKALERNERESTELYVVLGEIGYEKIDRIEIEIYQTHFDERDDQVIFVENTDGEEEISWVVTRLLNYTRRSPNHPSYSGLEGNVDLHFKDGSPSLNVHCKWMEKESRDQPSHYFKFSLEGARVALTCVNEALYQYLNEKYESAVANED